MWRSIIGQATYQIIVMVTLLYAAPSMFGITYDMINCPDYITSDNKALTGESTNKMLH